MAQQAVQAGQLAALLALLQAEAALQVVLQAAVHQALLAAHQAAVAVASNVRLVMFCAMAYV